MNHADRMRRGQRLTRLKHVAHGELVLEWTSLFQQRAQVLTVEVLHDHEGLAILERADVDDPCDMIALDARRGLCLPQEARDQGLPPIFGFNRRPGQELERDFVVQHEVLGLDDDAHAARAENALDPILASEDIAALDLGRARTGAHEAAIAWASSGQSCLRVVPQRSLGGLPDCALLFKIA